MVSPPRPGEAGAGRKALEYGFGAGMWWEGWKRHLEGLSVGLCRVTCAVPARGDVVGLFPAVFPAVLTHPSLLGDGLGDLGVCGWGNPWSGMGTRGQGQQGGGDTGCDTGSVRGPRRAAQNFGAAEGCDAEDNEK